jgi:hypothetical protein
MVSSGYGVITRRRLFGAIGGGLTASFRKLPHGAFSMPTIPYIVVDDYCLSDDADDTAAFVRATAAAAENGRPIALSGREYLISATIDVPSGLHFLAAGAVAPPGNQIFDQTKSSSRIRRTKDFVMFRIKGQSSLTGGPLRHSVFFDGITFSGGGFPSDTVQLIAVSRAYMRECYFVNSTGRHILFWEAWDCRIENTDFEWGGTADGTVPMIELRSGNGYEYTNQVHFVGCRLESYPGTALAVTGNNTNEIFVTNCKFESLFSNLPAITLDSAVTVSLSPVQITSRGDPTHTLQGQIIARNCGGIFGTLLSEHIGPSNAVLQS